MEFSPSWQQETFSGFMFSHVTLPGRFFARVTSHSAAEKSRYLLESLKPNDGWIERQTTLAPLRPPPCSLHPSPLPLGSCNPAAVEGIYCCAPLFDARCTYLHFSTLRSFHVRRLRIKYTRGGFVRDASFWGPLCRRRGCSAEAARRSSDAGGRDGGRREGGGADSGHSSSQHPQS